MFWLKPLTTRGQASEGDNNDTQVAWLRIAGDQVSRAQLAEARKTFGVHVDTCSLSLAGYHDVSYTLPDGSRMRIVSNSGIHHAVLWPVGGGDETKLPHGFLVVTNWANPKIYKRRLTTPITWAVDPIAVPQAKQPIEADTQVFRATGPNSYFNHPLVLTDATPRRLWDYTKRGVEPAFVTARPVVPVCVASDSKYSTADVHYCIDNVVYGKTGAPIYTMALASPILVSDPEAVVHGAPNTTANGQRLLLQHYRAAIISPTFGVYRVRCASEVLERLVPSGDYSATRTAVEFDGPLGGTSPSFGAELAFSEVPAELSLKVASVGVGGSTGFATYVDRFRLEDLAWGSTITRSDFEYSDPLTPDEPVIIPSTLAMAGAAAVESPRLTVETNASGTQQWRGGWIRRSVAPGLFGSGQSWFGRFGYEITRRDSNLQWLANPAISYSLGWANLKLLEGNAGTNCIGGEWIDIDFRGRNGSDWQTSEPQGYFPSLTYIVPGVAPPYFGPDLSPTWEDDMAAASVKAEVLAEVVVNPEGQVFGGPNALTAIVKDERSVNQAGYTYKSRYVIDFDSKGQFWAAIRVEVTSSGAKWTDDNPGGVPVNRGDMRLDVTPTTTVRIFFESNWKGTVDSQLLAEATTSLRPPFEYAALERKNPFTFATPSFAARPTMFVRVPPVPSMPHEALSQLRTLMQHQGVNTNLVCADVRPDITGDVADNVQSKTGIEFSTFDGRAIQPHRKYVTGQLYARTFKVSDFPDAIWLLRALKCDARENDTGSGPAWFYMPDLIAAINNQVFHIEVRDGVITQWSDDIPPAIDQPPALERDIKLYRV